jgi:hypothetical protein
MPPMADIAARLDRHQSGLCSGRKQVDHLCRVTARRWERTTERRGQLVDGYARRHRTVADRVEPSTRMSGCPR